MDIIVFDLESTGTDITKARIVQIAARKLNPEFGDFEPIKKMLINPEVPIPAEATAVHGITDDMVKACPTFRQISKGLFDYTAGCALAGFNILNYDVPLLAEEFNRFGIVWPGPGTKYVDAYRIFAEKEKRDLAGAAKFYLNAAHETAHDAGGDVEMTYRVLLAQLEKYPDLKEGGLDGIHTFSVGANAVDIAGKLAKNEAGEVVYTFGKDKGLSVIRNPGFAHWMLKPEQAFPADTKRILRELLNIK